MTISTVRSSIPASTANLTALSQLRMSVTSSTIRYVGPCGGASSTCMFICSSKPWWSSINSPVRKVMASAGVPRSSSSAIHCLRSVDFPI